MFLVAPPLVPLDAAILDLAKSKRIKKINQNLVRFGYHLHGFPKIVPE